MAPRVSDECALKAGKVVEALALYEDGEELWPSAGDQPWRQEVLAEMWKQEAMVLVPGQKSC